MTDLVPLALRLAVRRLNRRRSYAIAGLLIFGIGTAVSAFLFGLYRGLFLRPLPYPDDRQLYTIGSLHPVSSPTPGELVGGALELVRYAEEATAFDAVGGHTPTDLSMLIGDRTEGVLGESVTPSLFAMFGARMLYGRPFSMEENRDLADVVVVSERFWRRRLGADPGVVGRSLRIEGRPFAVVGIAAASFRTLFMDADVYVPLGITPTRLGPLGRRTTALVGRLAPGVTPAQAEAQIRAISATIAAEYPDTHREYGAYIRPMREQYFQARRPVLRVLSLGLGILMLIGCVNLAQLALVDATARRGEHILQLSLGARPGRVVGEQALQNLLLAVGGGGLGLLLARLGGGAILRLDPALARQAGPVVFDGWMGLVALGVALLAAVLASTLPLLWAGRARASLRHDDRSGGKGQRVLRLGLLGTEVAIAVVLLLGGGIVVLGLYRMNASDTGWRTDELMATQLVLPASRYPATIDRSNFVSRLLHALRAGPGVEDAAVSMTRFRVGSSMQTTVAPEGRAETIELKASYLRRITPGMLRMAGARLIAGREFLPSDDTTTAPVAIVSRSFAEYFWPGHDAVGRRFKRPVSSPVWTTVVGVVEDIHDTGPGYDLGPTVYLPYFQNSVAGVSRSPATILIRARGDPEALTEFVRRTVTTLDPDLAVEPVRSVDDLAAGALDPQRLQAILLGGFTVVALFLVAAGLAGVTSYGVSERRREFGIRLALGATSRGVLVLVLGQVLAAVATGAILAALFSGLVRNLAGGLVPVEPPSVAGLLSAIVVAVLAFAAVTSVLAVRRVSQIDPQEALK